MIESDGSYGGTPNGNQHKHSDSAGGTDGRGHIIGHAGTTGSTLINAEITQSNVVPVTLDSHIARFLSAETDNITLSTPLLTTNDISVSPGSTWFYGNYRTRPFSYIKLDSDGIGNLILDGSNQPKIESDGTFDGTSGNSNNNDISFSITSNSDFSLASSNKANA